MQLPQRESQLSMGFDVFRLQTGGFAELRHRLRSFVFPMTVAFLAWYLLYVLCSAFARGFMAHKLVGNLNVGLLFGFLQFLSTFGIAYLYARYANRRLDPLADKLRGEIDRGVR